MYKAYITYLKNIKAHPNADRLNIAEAFGNPVIVSKDYNEQTLYIYFPSDGQLSVEYATVNNLVRKKDEAGNQVGGYLDPSKRNITAIRLRGERSDGLIMPLSSLEFTGVDINEFKNGDVIDIVNGVEICRKYIPRSNRSGRATGSNGNKTRKKKAPIAPLFAEHADTQQLQYNLSAFKPGDLIEITEKCHGTSARTGYLPVLKGFKRSLLDIILRRDGKPIYDWGYVSGTRRTVLEDFEGGYYGSNAFREQHSKIFEGKLHKSETIYGEIVGFTDNGTPIMPVCQNKKLNDKEFIKKYGETTVFSYGCTPSGKKTIYGEDDISKFAVDIDMPQSDFYAYRMTSTNEDGDVIEYSPEQLKFRCEQMGIKTVPLLWKGFIPEDVENAGEWVLDLANGLIDGPSTIDTTHIREGVVVRIVNRSKLESYKYKSFNFKLLEGIIKNDATQPDMEEAEGEK